MKAKGGTRATGGGLLICLFTIAHVTYAQNRGWDCLLANSTSEANSNNLHGMTFHQDRFVAVGDSGTIMVSTNATQWVRQPTPSESSLYGITWTEGQFMAVGDNGCILLSSNGDAWASATTALTNNLRAVAFGNGAYVALTDDSHLLISNDSTTWQLSTNGLPPSSLISGILFGGDQFVAYGLGVIVNSKDGLNWTKAEISAPTYFGSGAYGAGIFLLAGHEDFVADQVAWSTNGVAWTTENVNSPGNGMEGVCYGDDRFVAISAGQVICSADGQNWNTCGAGFPMARLAAYGLGYYVAIAFGSLSPAGAIYTSTNLLDWVQATFPVCPIQSLSYGNGIYVGISGNCGMIYSSEDGVHFIQRRSCGGFLTYLNFVNGLFVAAGTGILISADGTNWMDVPTPCSDVVWALDYTDGIWIAACGDIISSTDVTNWTTQLSNPGHIDFLLNGNNRWVACGWNGLIWTRTDGTNWQNCSFSTSANLGPISFEGGLFSIYSAGTFMTPESALVSQDGLRWFDSSRAGPLLALHDGTLSGTLAFSLAGKWQTVYSVQSSSDLKHWGELQRLTNTTGVTSLAVTNSSADLTQFFRAVAR